MSEDSCSSFDYDEFGQIEVCYPDRLVIRPVKGVLALDAVLFDQHGNFIGPVSQVLGGPLNPRYVIQVSEEIVRARRYSLKPNDSVYYYNCDRLEADPTGMDEEGNPQAEHNLASLNRKNRRHPQRDQKISKMILKSVINNLRNLTIDERDDSVAEVNNRDRESILAEKSTSITSMIFKSYQDKSKIASVKEQLKKKKYRKYKNRIIQQFYKFQEEANLPRGSEKQDSDIGNTPSDKHSVHLFSHLQGTHRTQGMEPIEDELGNLGKRQPPSDKPRRRKKTLKNLHHQDAELTATHHAKSSGSSRLSQISEPSPELFGASKAVSELRAPWEDGSLALSTHRESCQFAAFDLHSELGMEDELRMDQEPLSLAFKFSYPPLTPSSHPGRPQQEE